LIQSSLTFWLEPSHLSLVGKQGECTYYKLRYGFFTTKHLLTLAIATDQHQFLASSAFLILLNIKALLQLINFLVAWFAFVCTLNKLLGFLAPAAEVLIVALAKCSIGERKLNSPRFFQLIVPDLVELLQYVCCLALPCRVVSFGNERFSLFNQFLLHLS
jgi:hypothetical protein